MPTLCEYSIMLHISKKSSHDREDYDSHDKWLIKETELVLIHCGINYLFYLTAMGQNVAFFHPACVRGIDCRTEHG